LAFFLSFCFLVGKINAAPTEAGLAARWSLSKIKGSVVGLFRDRSGTLSVNVLQGYNLEPISTSDIDYIFNNYTLVDNAVGFAYVLNGFSFYQITFPNEIATWLYSFDSKSWCQLKSYGYDRHIGNLAVAFRNKLIFSSFNSNALYRIDTDIYTDNGILIEREITGAHSFSPSQNYLSISRLRLDLEGGVGLTSGQGDNPEIMLSISRDRGHTWGNELRTTIGRLGNYMHRAEWRRLGIARDWVFKIRITDSVKCVIIGAVIEARELNK